MALKFFRKKAPPTLPDLGIDSHTDNDNIEDETDSLINELSKISGSSNRLPISSIETLKKIDLSNSNKKSVKKLVEYEDEAGFFKDILKNITHEMNDIEKLDTWYKSKFKGNDIVEQMRNYWEKQKPELVLRNMNSDLVNNLKEKIAKFHDLEKEWQEIYVTMLGKEEEMREDEEELKEMLSQFIKICKRKMGKRDK